MSPTKTESPLGQPMPDAVKIVRENAATRRDSIAGRKEADAALMRTARLKIIRAQDRGTLSAGLGISLHQTQIVLSSPTEKDLAWLVKNFGGEQRRDPGRWVTRRKERKAVGDGYYTEVGRPKPHDTWRWSAPLRDPEDQPKHYYGGVPRVEVQSILKPHTCIEWMALANRDARGARRTRWACRACGKALGKRDAAAMGLTP